jgi:WD40 repeat protein
MDLTLRWVHPRIEESVVTRFWICFVALMLGTTLLAGDPPGNPVLCLETGMHSAAITGIATDAPGHLALTVSHDKTARLWGLPSGQLLHVFRPPHGDGHEGKLYGCALSPDGRMAAFGGYTGHSWDGSDSIYLFDTATGALLRRLPGLPEVVRQLAFSPDGTRMAACLAGRNGIRVFNAADGKELFRDAEYGSDSCGADFNALGQLVTTSLDGQVRLYGPEGALLAKVPAPGGQHPGAIRFNPDGTTLALCYGDTPRVDVLAGAGLQWLFSPDTAGTSSGLKGLAWSRDGETLFAAGHRFKWQEGRRKTMNRFSIRSWSKGGHGPAKDKEVGATDTISDLASLPGGGLLWASMAPSWGQLNGAAHTGANVDFMGMNLELNRTGTQFSFHYANHGKVVLFNLAGRRISSEEGDPLSAPRTEGLPIQGWKNGNSPTFAGMPLPMKGDATARCLAIAPDLNRFLLGTEWSLTCFDAQGKQVWRQPGPGVAWAVNISGDGTLGVAAYGDGTIRWYRMADGREQLAFFPHVDQKRWVLWTPSGSYDASPGGEDLIGWHLNRGKDAAADFFPASRFRAQFYRPDAVAKALTAPDEGAAPARANEAGGAAMELQAILPPKVRILSPGNGTPIEAGTVTLRAAVRSANQNAIDAVWAAVDGRRVEGRGLRLQPAAGADGEKIYSLEVPMPPQDCTVSVFARSGSAVSEAAVIQLAWARPPVQPDPAAPASGFVIRPKLYVLAIGVSVYQRSDLALGFPAKDARDLAAAFAVQKGRLFRDVEVKLLTDGAATKDNVMDGLEWLEREVTAKDVAVMFLAGHGINDTAGQYYFLPANADPERIKRTMVADSDMRSTLAKLSGKVLFFLDTCHSGNILGGVKQRGSNDLNGFINELASAENGVVVFSASTGRQASLESKEWNNGAFTKAVVEGLSGKADFQHTGRVTVNMLDLYISERVKELTHGTQAPTTAKPSTVPDFPVAMVN